MGRAALEGLPGVHQVSSGFKGFREVNTVTYDPARISPEKMIQALRKVGTYAGTAQE